MVLMMVFEIDMSLSVPSVCIGELQLHFASTLGGRPTQPDKQIHKRDRGAAQAGSRAERPATKSRRTS